MKTTNITILAGMALLASVSIQAQTQRSGGDTARVMQQLQQMTAEKSKLQQDNEALKKEFETLKSKAVQDGAERAKLQLRVNQLEMESSKQQALAADHDAALDKSKGQLQELLGKFRETAQRLKELEIDRDEQALSKTNKERELAACVDKNAQLYLLGNSMLDKLEDQSVWSVIKTKEPFTQLSRTQLENLVDEYRVRINELKLAQRTASVSQ